MAFPDSSKKAPNVFISVTDGTGTAPSVSSTGGSLPSGVNFSTAGTEPPKIFNQTVNDSLSINSLTVLSGILEFNFTTSELYPVLVEDSAEINPLSIIGGELSNNTYYTTTLYPMLIEDILSISSLGILSGSFIDNLSLPPEPISISPLSILSGSLDTIVIKQDMYETLVLQPLTITDGSLQTIVITQDMYETLVLQPLTIIGGSLETIVVSYNNWEIETVGINSLNIISGSLE